VAVSDGFVAAILESPVGVALLARLESRVKRTEGYGLDQDTSPDAVLSAAESVGHMSFGELVELIALTGTIDVGPWIPDASATAANAYRHAEARAPIAEAVNHHFCELLHAPLDRDLQQWWSTERLSVDQLAPLFQEFEEVYDAGQFTWAGLWTVTDPPELAHAQLVDVWELYYAPIGRWHLPVLSDARVFEVHRPEDWARLVAEHPRDAVSHMEHWELPGINQNRSELSELMAVRGQRAARTSIRRHLVPDWRSVADRYDGVHLSWAGFLTAEGCITDGTDRDVTMLRYWFSERTHWLADVFGKPHPAAAPSLEDLFGDGIVHAVDVTTNEQRRARDAHALDQLLGR